MDRVTVLGGGITGLTVAMDLSRVRGSAVRLVERSDQAGGLASSTRVGDRVVDIGSHRVHRGYEPRAWHLVRDLLGDDLVERPRRGQIRIDGRFLRYPPSPLEAVSSFGVRAALSMGSDFARALPGAMRGLDRAGTFEEYATRAVGRSMYERFYRPYALKLWGVDPAALSYEAAVGRVKRFSPAAVARDVRGAFTRRRRRDVYFYPRGGFGQIAGRLEQRVRAADARVDLSTEVVALEIADARRIRAVHLRHGNGEVERHETETVVSTLPFEAVSRLVARATNREPAETSLAWRGLRVLYLLTSDRIRSGHETFYFPEPDVVFGRVSEPAQYSAHPQPPDGRTLLTIEVPCSPGDSLWSMDDDSFGAMCERDLRRIGILPGRSGSPSTYVSSRVPGVYPIYRCGWRDRFEHAIAPLDAIENLYLVGRPALFLHCNVDHCMSMALRLTALLRAGGDRRREWIESRRSFREFALHD